MKKRNIIISSLLYISLSWLISFSLATFNLNFIWINIQSIEQKTSDIIFRASGNDFMGSVFWLNAKSIDWWKTISISGQTETKICYKQIKWMYYNSQRGNRLRPLDEDTLEYFKISSNTYNDLDLTWWLYTSCSGDEYGMYGQIIHSVNGDTMPYYMVAWTKYNWNSNTISGEFAKSFQRFDNKFPIWYIYDNRGWWIWFIWGSWDATAHAILIDKINSGSWINQLFEYQWTNNSEIKWKDWGISIFTTKWNAINTLMNAWVQGTIWFSFSANTIENKSIIGNLDRRTIIFNTLNINLSKLLNEVRKNSESLCKDKYVPRSQVSNNLSGKNVFCIENSNILINDNTQRDNLKNKVIVLNSWNIQIARWMTAGQWPISIFIEKWNLLVSNNTWSAINFDANGYATTAAWVSKWIYLKWNFIVNGLIIWADATTRIQTGFKHKLFFNWKVASLNTPSYPSQGRLDHVKSLFGNTGYNSWIWLGNTFTWQCNPVTGSWSDNGFTPCNDPADRNAMLPLIIIDGYYPSSLIK